MNETKTLSINLHISKFTRPGNVANVRRDEQDREARRVGGRTCFWRSLVMLTFR